MQAEILEPPPSEPKNEMFILDHTGDVKVQWNRQNQDEISVARDTFEKLKGKGYAAFKMTASGSQGEQIRTFDPSYEHVILVPPIAGG